MTDKEITKEIVLKILETKTFSIKQEEYVKFVCDSFETVYKTVSGIKED